MLVLIDWCLKIRQINSLCQNKMAFTLGYVGSAQALQPFLTRHQTQSLHFLDLREEYDEIPCKDCLDVAGKIQVKTFKTICPPCAL